MHPFYKYTNCAWGVVALALSFVGTMRAEDTRARNTIILNEVGERNLQIETALADYRDFEETVFAIGRIEEIPSSRSVVSTRVAGRVVELQAFEGDQVEAGQFIATIESRQLGDPPPSVKLQAPQSGLVVASHVRIGQPVEPSQELMDIVDRSTVWAVAQIPEQEAAQVEVGAMARIHVPSLGDEWISAKLTRFGVEADPHTGTVEGIFVLDNPEGRLRPGMRAEFSIVLKKHRDVLAVPREAVQGDPAHRVVFVRDFDLPHAFLRLPVELGLQNERYVEVRSGLFPGDEVVTRGSYGLSFAGSGAGMSLKEALDAAHGHDHNEDGSEITDGGHEDHGHDEHDGHEEHAHGAWRLVLVVYSVVVTLLCLVLLQRTLRKPAGEVSGDA